MHTQHALSISLKPTKFHKWVIGVHWMAGVQIGWMEEGIEIDDVQLVNGWDGMHWMNFGVHLGWMNIFEIDELHLDGWRWIMDQVHIE
jgi:hypothetical protein